MKKPNKKSMIFQPLLVVVTFLVLLFALFSLDTKYKSLAGKNEFIGDKQTDIVGVYQDAENILFYIDQSAKLSSKKSVYELGQRGGHYGEPGCGSYSGYYFWQKKDDVCYPTEFRKSLKLLLNDNLNNYLGVYPSGLVRNNYEFAIFNKKLIGTAFENLNLGITDSKEIVIGNYSIKPSFSIDFDYDMGYELLIEHAKNLNLSCNGKSGDELEECVGEFLDVNNLEWSFDQRLESLVLFDIITDKKVLIYSGSEFVEEDVTIKFAIDISQ